MTNSHEGDENVSPAVKRRVVLHFPGFEPLSAEDHYKRYVRGLLQSADIWGMTVTAGPLQHGPAGAYFTVQAEGQAWKTESRIHIFDHNGLVAALNARPLWQRLWNGYKSGYHIAADGAAYAYFRHAWRFGLFYVFPFLFIGLGLVLSALIAFFPLLFTANPALCLVTMPLSLMFFLRVFRPWSDRYHMLHLLSDWDMAVDVAGLQSTALKAWLQEAAQSARIALDREADDYLVTSHSMGSNLAAHVLGALFEAEAQGTSKPLPPLSFVTLGGAVLQCALLRRAKVLRERVGLLARQPGVYWLEVQCLTDPIHFYRAKTIALCGHEQQRQADILLIRVKQMLTATRYKRIKKDMLRVHRQYVLPGDMRSPYEFSVLTAGPFTAKAFTRFTKDNLPPV